MKYFLLLLGILAFISCQQRTIPELAFPPNEKTQITIEEAAVRIVTKDNNEIADKNDIRVKRVQYLMTELTNDGDNLSLNGKCHLLELSTKILADKYGVKITMQEYLEEMKKAKDLKISETLDQKPTFGNLTSLVAVKKGR